MNPRTRFLAILAMIAVTLLLGDQAYRRVIEEPTAKRAKELEDVQKRIREAKDRMADAASAKDAIVELERLSLPYDPELARVAYQDWLLGLLKAIDFQQTSVDASTPSPLAITDRLTNKPKEFARKYVVSVRGRGSLQQLTRLLYQFHVSPHLHKIRSVTLSSLSGGQLLDVSLTVEALSLTRCERKGDLASGSSNRLGASSLDDYQVIVRRNLFSEDAASALRHVVLTAVTFDKSGVPNAWFSVGEAEPTQVVVRGDHLSIAAHDIQVIDIQPHLVLIDLDGLLLSLPLGKSVQDVVTPHPSSA